MSAPPRRRWLRYSLRTFFVVVTLVGVWLGVELKRIREQAHAVSMLEGMGAIIWYDYQWSDASGAFIPDTQPPGPEWLKNLLGSHYRANVKQVFLSASQGEAPEKLNDENASVLSALTEADLLILMDTNITDAGLTHFKTLKNVIILGLEGTRVTTDGAQELCKSLPNLRVYFGSHDDTQMCVGAAWDSK